MARQNHGPLSRAKGKLGGVVYQQYEGMQISREYQPVVKNPQTTKQTENRAKFKLSSQIVAQFAEVFNARLAKLSIYSRIRRGACVNAIYGVVDVKSETNLEALVADVVSAVNAKSISGDNEVSISNNSGDISITAPNGYVVSFTTATYNHTTGELIGLTNETYTSAGTTKMVDIYPGERNIVMATGFHALTESGRATIANMSAQSTKFDISIARAIANGDIEVSNIVAEVVDPS